MSNNFKQINFHIFLTLDIETSTDYDNDGKPVNTFLSYGVCKEWVLIKKEPREVNECAFRDWEELDDFLTKIDSKQIGKGKVLCFVHNLAFEYSFLSTCLYTPDRVLASSAHKPIACSFVEIPNIEFRCTYQMSQMSLKRMGVSVGLPKLESDYRYIRPCDKVYPVEWDYCRRDTVIPALYVGKFIRQGYTLQSLPYTSTGFVRNDFKSLYKRESNPTWDKVPTEREYQLMQEAFYGGITISNPRNTGKVLTNVSSFDETSAYPYVMLSEQFPVKINHTRKFTDFTVDRGIAKIRLKNVRSKFTWGWLSIHRMDVEGDFESFNGKILRADGVVGSFTDVDFNAIKMTYTFDGYDVLDAIVVSEFEKIPECYSDLIAKYAKRKSELKRAVKSEPDNKDLLFDYAMAKSRLNSIYGMSVEKLVKPEWTVDENGEWYSSFPPYSDFYDKTATKNNGHVGRSFMIGVYVTAYARYNLLKAIVTNCPDSFVYADTDSVKFVDDRNKKFVDTNKPMPPTASEGTELMGKFDFEGTYDKFITWGAKKYASEINGEINVTVAGLPKRGWNLDKIENFKPVKVFEKCKLAHSYLPNGCALYPVDYTLDITDNDKIILEQFERYWIK